MTDSRRDADRLDAGRPTFSASAAAGAGSTGSARNARSGLRPSSAPRVPFALLVAGLMVGGLALLLVLNTASAANELTRQHYAESDNSVAAQVQQLRNDVAASAAPGNLARAARALGMVPGGNAAFVVVQRDGKIVVRGSAAPASEVQVQVPKAPKPKPSSSATATSTGSPTGTATVPPTSTGPGATGTPATPRTPTVPPATRPASGTPAAPKTPHRAPSTQPRRTGGHR